MCSGAWGPRGRTACCSLQRLSPGATRCSFLRCRDPDLTPDATGDRAGPATGAKGLQKPHGPDDAREREAVQGAGSATSIPVIQSKAQNFSSIHASSSRGSWLLRASDEILMGSGPIAIKWLRASPAACV